MHVNLRHLEISSWKVMQSLRCVMHANLVKHTIDSLPVRIHHSQRLQWVPANVLDLLRECRPAKSSAPSLIVLRRHYFYFELLPSRVHTVDSNIWWLIWSLSILFLIVHRNRVLGSKLNNSPLCADLHNLVELAIYSGNAY